MVVFQLPPPLHSCSRVKVVQVPIGVMSKSGVQDRLFPCNTPTEHSIISPFTDIYFTLRGRAYRNTGINKTIATPETLNKKTSDNHMSGFSPKRHTVALRPPSLFGRPSSNSKAPCFKVPAPEFFDAQKDLNVHARYPSSGKAVAMGTWHAFIRK